MIYVVAGPTAVGKTKYSIELAKKILDGDEVAKAKLCQANLRLVVSIAKNI